MATWYLCIDTGSILSESEYQSLPETNAQYGVLGDFPSRDAAKASVPHFLDIHYAVKEVQAFLSLCSAYL